MTKTIKRLLPAALAVLLAGCAMQPVDSTTTRYRVALVAKNNRDSEFWDAVFTGAEAAATEYNLQLTITAPDDEEDYAAQNQLIADAVEDGARAIIESVRRIGVADFANDLTGDLLHRSVGGRFQLPGDNAKAVGDQRFASNARFGIIFNNVIKDCVADLIGHFIGVPLGDRFGGKNILFRHKNPWKKCLNMWLCRLYRIVF